MLSCVVSIFMYLLYKVNMYNGYIIYANINMTYNCRYAQLLIIIFELEIHQALNLFL